MAPPHAYKWQFNRKYLDGDDRTKRWRIQKMKKKVLLKKTHTHYMHTHIYATYVHSIKVIALAHTFTMSEPPYASSVVVSDK